MKHPYTPIAKQSLFAAFALFALLSTTSVNAQWTKEEVLHHVGVAFKYPNITYESQPDFTQMTSAQEYFDATWATFEAKPYADGSYYIRFSGYEVQPFGSAQYSLSAVQFTPRSRYVHYQRELDSKEEMESFFNLTVSEIKRAGGVLLGPDIDMGIHQQITFPEAYPNIVIRLSKGYDTVYLDIRVKL
ncbi:MAG: hypothetical protein J6V31_04155 [Tidjanibacter sp.]|nr:hypothetical protein [Tidjanibacter sp.]